VAQPISARQERLVALERLRLQLDPRAPLRRGYVLVTDSQGRVMKTAAIAAAEPSLTLEFEDGKLDVVPGPAGGTAQRRSASGQTKPAKAKGSGEQAELF